jgi:2-oxoisovalerate dehydrogenase E2 component (dihydrolipoyl transacylase)
MSVTANGTNGIVEVTVPHLAESLVSATVSKWLRQPGDVIEQYDVLCELMTEKVNTEMPSPVGGKLVEIIVNEGVTAAVGETICLIQTLEGSAAAESGISQSSESITDLKGVERVNVVASSVTEDAHQSMRNRYSPAVQKLAADHGIDLRSVPGSGLGGRITRKDVEEFVQSGGAAAHGIKQAVPEATSAEATVTQPSKMPVRSTGIHLNQNIPTPMSELEGHSVDSRGETYIDVTPIRNSIATKMRQSVLEIPHAWTMIEVDVTNLVMLRNKVKDEFQRKEGINLTYLAFMLKAVVGAIKDYPIINSVWAVDKIIVKRDINISLAVGTEDSVLTPVIRKADQKNIAGLAREIDEYTKKARAGKLQLSELQGGTFTVNNTGSFGSILSMPIINYPQAAIVTFESIVKKPVVIQDMIAVRSMVNLCLSLDHRILDGVICGRFLQRVKENLEGYNMETALY